MLLAQISIEEWYQVLSLRAGTGNVQTQYISILIANSIFDLKRV